MQFHFLGRKFLQLTLRDELFEHGEIINEPEDVDEQVDIDQSPSE